MSFGHGGDVGGDSVTRIVDDDRSEPSGGNLEVGRAVVMGVIPVRTAHVVGGDVVDVVAAESAFEHAGHVVAGTLTRDVEAVGVQVGDVGIFEDVVFAAG